MKLSVASLSFLVVLAWGQTFTNPIIWEDLADLDVFRVGSSYYYSASTMHYSPGAPILQSYDLVNWQYIGHSVPTLNFPGLSNYNLTNGQRAYVKGIYASSLRYRQSNGLFYWIGCIEYSKTYIYTAPSITGPWTQQATLDTCYYDCGLLVDDDDSLYVAYGSTTVNVAQLSSDGLSQASTQAVYTAPSTIGTIEGNRFYKYNGTYYILVDHPATAEYVLRSTSGPFGPYTAKVLVNSISSPVAGSGNPHQGGLVQTESGTWYYMAFIDSYPGGRVPVLAPVTWGSDGFPVVQTVNGGWGASYPYPATQQTLGSLTGTDTFSGTSLGPQWEWNHNPDTTEFTVNNGLQLYAATVTSDIYAARNTLTHRILGPTSTGTVVLDSSNMLPGDRAGLVLLRDNSAWVGVTNDAGAFSVCFVNQIIMNTDWTTQNTGVTQSCVAISKGNIWLRIGADIQPGSTGNANFYYSTDGTTYDQLGSFTMDTTWEFFMGYRFGIFNYATTALGGSVAVSSFTLATP